MWWEISILLALSLGRSAAFALLSLVDLLTSQPALGDVTVAMNTSMSPRPVVDALSQLLSIGFSLAPVALALYLLAVRPGARPLSEVMGWDWHLRGREVSARYPHRRRTDCAWGLALAAAVGIPGLAFYAAGRAMGITVTLSAANLGSAWWSVPIYILASLRNGLLEEVIVVAYLYERTRDLGWSQRREGAAHKKGTAHRDAAHREDTARWDPATHWDTSTRWEGAVAGGSEAVTRLDWRFVAFSAVLRGSYHLYQGIGPMLGNMAMGVLFACWYRSRWGRRRIWPLIIAHLLIDTVAFVGYAFIPEHLLHTWGLA